MTVFGTTLEPMQIFGVVSLLLVLVLWIMAFKGDRNYARWFRSWEADRKARRDAELAAERGEAPPANKRGPWG